MKKLSISSAFFLLVVLIISCNKQSEIVTQPFTGTGTTNRAPATHTIISDWFWLALNTVSERGVSSLQGTKPFDRRVEYDLNTHVELAYVSMPVQRRPIIRRLPMKLKISQLGISQNSQDDMYSFQFSMGNSGFNLSVKNANDPSLVPDPTIIQDFKYRYIIIPSQVYHTLSVDWDNYDEVARALNL